MSYIVLTSRNLHIAEEEVTRLIKLEGGVMEYIEDIKIEVAGKELDYTVCYTKTQGVEPYTSGLPEHCHEGEPEEIVINWLQLKGDKDIDSSNLIRHINKELIEILSN